MGPRVEGTSAASTYDVSTPSPQNSTTVMIGENTLSDVASRLHLSPDDLLLANPQIKDPWKLAVGQEIHLPQGQTSQSAGTQSGNTPLGNPNLPRSPIGDPIAESVWKSHLSPTNMDGTERQSPATNQSINFANLPEFKALPAGVQKQLLDAAAKDPSVEMRLQQVLQRPLYSQLTTQQRTELLNVFAKANPEGRQELVQLMGRHLPNGDSALLSKDASGQHATLLDNLNKLADQPLTPAAAGRRSEILSQVIDDAAEPTWYMDQGNVGTCVPTTFQTHLLMNNPSEYARLLGGLFGPDRKATLANGDTMIPAMDDLNPNPTVTLSSSGASIPDSRSITERVFQSSLAQYAYIQAGHVPPFVNASGSVPGLNLNESAKALSALYGREYTNVEAGPATIGTIMNELANHHGPIPVDLHWGSGYHELLVDHMEKDKAGNVKVYLRNPWGSSAAQAQPYKDGQTLGSSANNSNAGPARTVADQQSGLEVMSLPDFISALDGAAVPKD